MVRSLVVTILVGGFFVGSTEVQAQTALPDDQYRIDLFEGPVLGSTRVISLGGAFAALAEQSVGIPFNPASVAHRTHYSDTRFDWDVALDWISPGIFQPDDFDFDTNGDRYTTSMMAGLIGGHIQFGTFGIGALLRGQRFRFRYEEPSPSTITRRFEGSMGFLQLTGGYAFWRHQLIVGLGVRMGLLDLKERDADGNSFKAQSAAFDLGFLYRPEKHPFRIALGFCSPAEADTDVEDSLGPSPLLLPKKGVAIPWEVRIGGALRIGGPP
ncbi:MAG: hypothetical protein ACYS47_12725, partial [Planctomycetota bacterium]